MDDIAVLDAPGERAVGRRHVEHVMGTAVSIDVRDADDHAAGDGRIGSAVRACVAWLHEVDAVFSPYRPESQVRRFARGELALEDCRADVRWIIGLCEDLRRTTGGAFDARTAGPDGGFDPSGAVKGWAMEEGVRHLEAAGLGRFVVNAGGDVFARGEPAPGRPWRVGIRHPDDPTAIAAVLEVRDRAVATSGTYERGAHLRDARTGTAAAGLRSLTVVGPSLTFADAWATAGFVMGLDGVPWVASHAGYAALAITLDGQLVWTPELEPRLVRPVARGPVAPRPAVDGPWLRGPWLRGPWPVAAGRD